MKEQIKITKENIIKTIANQTDKNIADVRDFYNTLVEASDNDGTDDRDVCIKLFEGISLDGTYIKEKMKKINLSGEEKLIPSKIKPKFNITRTYCNKLNNK